MRRLVHDRVLEDGQTGKRFFAMGHRLRGSLATGLFVPGQRAKWFFSGNGLFTFSASDAT
jgi:hypothetical protein